jgi:hypothetical protein
MKLLLWVILIGAALLALRLVNLAAAKRRKSAAQSASPQRSGPDNMVRCVRCGVYVPSTDAKPGPDGLTCGEPVCLERR